MPQELSYSFHLGSNKNRKNSAKEIATNALRKVKPKENNEKNTQKKEKSDKWTIKK